MNTQYIRLNMVPAGVLPVMHVSQYDIGRPLGVVVYDGSAEIDLDDYTVTIEATRTDGTPITAAVTTNGNIGAFVTTATMTNKEDLYPAQLVIVDGDSNRVASLPFMMRVVKAAMDENSESIEEDAPLYQQYNAAIQALIVDVRADLNNAITNEANARQAADSTLQSNINSEALTRAAADNTLQAQIDQIIAPSGGAPSAAEVEDARIGANGTVYNTLGNAIRSQISVLQDIFDTDGYIYNTIVKGSFSASGAGSYTTHNRRLRTNFIPVKTGDIIIIKNGTLKHFCGAWLGTIGSGVNHRNDSAWITTDETIIASADSYYCVVFAKQNPDESIEVTDYDGSVQVFANELFRNGKKDEDLYDMFMDTVTQLYGKMQIKPDWYTGVYESSGYSNFSNKNYARCQVLPAGNYIITPASGYYCEVYTYVSDTSGTFITGYGMNGSVKNLSTEYPFVISSRKNPSATITDEERASYNDSINIVRILAQNNGDFGRLIKDEVMLGGALVYFYGSQKPTMSVSGSTITVTIPSDVRGVVTKDGALYGLSQSVASTSISVPNGEIFVYNRTTHLFSSMSLNAVNASTDDLILLFVNQNGRVYGQWERFVVDEKITSAITECKTYADGLISGNLPSYYDSYMPGKLTTIRTNIASAGSNGISFAFVSDIHYDRAGTNNTRNSPLLLQTISRKTAVKMMLCGGDLITLDTSKDGAMELLQDTITDFSNKSEMETFWAVGNHEFNNPGATEAGAANQLTTDAVVPIITQGRYLYIKYIHNSGAYIVDIPKDKTRILFNSCNYDSSLNTNAIAWLISMLDSTPDDYDLILISHLGIYRNTSNVYTGPVDDFKPLLAALQAYKQHTTYTYNDVTYNFTSKTGTVLGAFLGHYHSDGQGVWYGIPCCIITTDSLSESQYSPLTRTSGTTTEQAFDVVTINRSNGSIYCTRIGAGNDRQFVNGEWTVIS